MRIKVKANNPKAFDPVTPQRVDFQFSQFPYAPVVNGKHMHVAGIKLLIDMDIAQATAQAGVNCSANLAQLATVTLQRDIGDSSTVMLNAVPGDLIQLVAQDSRGGLHPLTPVVDIAANGTGSPVAHNARRLVLPIYFEQVEKLTIDKEDPMWPLAAFQAGQLSVSMQTPTAYDAGLSFGTGTNQIDYELILVPKDEPEVGQDIRWRVMLDPTGAKGTSTSIPIGRGTYRRLYYAPAAWVGLGGGSGAVVQGDPNLSTYLTSIDSVIGGQATAFPTRSAAQYVDDWFEQGHQDARKQPYSILGNGGALMLAGIAPGSSMFAEMFSCGKAFQMSVTATSNLQQTHRFLGLVLYKSNPTERARVAKASYPTFQGVVQPTTKAAGQVTPKNKKRAQFLKKTLSKTGTAAS